MIDVDYKKDEIIAAIKKHIASGRISSDLIYGDGTAGSQIADLLAIVEVSITKRLTY